MSINVSKTGNSQYIHQAASQITKKYTTKKASEIEKSATTRLDKLDLSPNAKLTEQDLKLLTIRDKILAGEYEKPEVYRELAKTLSQIFPPEIEAV